MRADRPRGRLRTTALVLACLVVVTSIGTGSRPTTAAQQIAEARTDPRVPVVAESPAASGSSSTAAAQPAASRSSNQSERRRAVPDSVPAVQIGAWLVPTSEPDGVVLVGDSLAQEVFGVVQFLTPGATVTPKYWGGTAPCDWLEVDLEADRASVVVISFTGNSLTPCMADGAGGQLHDEALVSKYRDDVATLVDRARRVGARVLLVGQPFRSASFDDDVEVNGINAAYEEYAAAFPHVSFVDAGAAVETPDGRYADRLPCTPYDIDCSPDGTTVVRGDGVHFCPIVGENPCSVWSSGAFRFGMAIADAAQDPDGYE